MLEDYEGALLFVSHDRHLISLLAQQLWLVEDGSVRSFAGTFEEWRRSVQAAAVPDPATAIQSRRASTPAVKQRPAKEQRPNLEKVIHELESLLRDIEQRLLVASEQQDVAEIGRLGEEHSAAEARLEQVWQEWADQE